MGRQDDPFQVAPNGDVRGNDAGEVRGAAPDERGLDSMTVDGQSVRYTDIEAKYRYCKREVAREKGTRPQAASINLGGF